MGSLLLTIASFLISLAILIAVHEFGHFWVARRLGVRVLRFSIGFGPVVWMRVSPRDGTEYAISALPLGGYVKMLDEREEQVAEADLPRAFNRQPLWIRSAIVAAGPIFNLLFAVLAFWLVLVSGDTGFRPLIGEVSPKTIAEVAGFQTGDEIITIDAHPTPTWESVILALMAVQAENREIAVRVLDTQGVEQIRWLSDNAIAKLADDAHILEKTGFAPAYPELPPRIGQIESGAPAEQAGLRPGDLLLRADEHPIQNWRTWVEYVRGHPGRSIALQIRRNGVTLNLSIRPIAQQDGGGNVVGHIGAMVEIPSGLYDRYQVVVRLGPLEALQSALSKTLGLCQIMLRVIWHMIIGQGQLDNLSGPLSIAEFAGKAASDGFSQFLKFLAGVSISLGVINLFPIPILDGGHLLFFLIEGIIGRPLSEQFRLQGQRIGVALLLMLMTLAFYTDLSRLLG